MDRRDALRRLVAAAVGATFAPPWVGRLLALGEARALGAQHLGPVEQAVKPWTPKALSVHQDETVATIGELIIPATDTPGARAAQVNRFIDAIIEDAHEAERREFLAGLDWMDARSRQLFGSDFIGAMPDQQTALLTILSSEQNTDLDDRPGVAFFTAIKALTITGYYHSEIGIREELRDDGEMVFADDQGCVHPEHQKPGAAR